MQRRHRRPVHYRRFLFAIGVLLARLLARSDHGLIRIAVVYTEFVLLCANIGMAHGVGYYDAPSENGRRKWHDMKNNAWKQLTGLPGQDCDLTGALPPL